MSYLQKTNGKYLWWSLLGLGFQPEAAAASIGVNKANIRHIVLGINMFDKPNKDAFYIVTYFLFGKLNPTRTHDLFRHCWPVLDRKADAEFRKVTFAWLRDIAAECGNAFPKVVASLFLSPGGAKFIYLMLHLAKHVMLHEIRSFATDDTWVPDAAAREAPSMEMAIKRFKLVKTRFLRAAVEQDCVVQDYQHRAQTLVKSIRDLRAEDAKYDGLLKRHEKEDEKGSLQMEKIKKVRLLWADANKVLSTLEEERKVVDSVVKGNVDQYVLDGTGLTLKIPLPLLKRIERSTSVSSAGNLYEAGELNVLRLLELLNEALWFLEEERSRVGNHALPLDLKCMEEQTQLMGRTLEALRLTARKLAKEDIPEVKTCVRNMETAWDCEWADCLARVPLTSFLSEDPAFNLLSPMGPLSFEPATEASFKSSIFSQYPAKLPDLPKEQPAVQVAETRGNVGKIHDLDSCCRPATSNDDKPASGSLSPKPSALCNVSLLCPVKPSVRKHAVVSEARQKMKKSVILDREFDNLANQFAEAIASSPVDCSKRALGLEELLCSLSDPFSTRKQLPRTPESLISEVKSSWRRAVEEGEAEKARLFGKFEDSFGRSVTPVTEPKACPSPVMSDLNSGMVLPCDSKVGHIDTSLLGRPGESLHSTLSWDATRSQSEDFLQFDIAHETMPEPLGEESLLSSSDGAQDAELTGEEEGELVLPQLLSHSKMFEMQCGRLGKIQDAYSEVSFVDCRRKSPESSLLQCAGECSPMGGDWDTTKKDFSLDLDTLGSPSPSGKEQFSLPKLVTFSPMDDLSL